MSKDMKVVIGTVVAGLVLVALLCWVAPAKAVIFIQPKVIVVSQAHDISADTNLVGLWYVENNGNDETVSGNNLLLTGNITYGTTAPAPKQGTYWAHAPGSTGSYLSITDATQTDLDTGGVRSFGGWVYITLGNRIISKHNATLGDYGWMFEITASAIDIDLSTDGSTWTNYVTGALGLSLSTWYHVVYVYDGSYQRLYIDGSEITSGDFPVAYSSNWNNSTGPFTLGGRASGTGFEGNFDEWFYTKDALTAQEISDIYNYGFTP